MKKTFAILAGGIAFALALNSCNNGNPAEQLAKDNLKIDSIVNVRLSQLRQSLIDSCQKATMAHAQAIADSILSSSGKKTVALKPKTTTPVTPQSSKDQKMSGQQTPDTKSKDDKMSGQQTPNTKSKDDKMNRNNPSK